MPRPKRHRTMQTPPLMNGFRPFGVPVRDAESVILLLEEYEALRLADYDNLNHEVAAARMQISRPTFSRIYDKARKTIAKAFVEGKAIFIEGGNVDFGRDWFRCAKCNHTFIASLSPNSEPDCPKCAEQGAQHINSTLNRAEPFALPTDAQLSPILQDCTHEKTCVCVNCGDVEMENVQQPCRHINCPKCNQPLIRKDSYQYNLLKQRGLIH